MKDGDGHMAVSGESVIEEIKADLACPQCEYNLRGLRGATVQCPECGHFADVAKLIARRRQGPWQRAPGLMKIESPMFVFVLGIPLISIFILEDSGLTGTSLTLMLLVWVALWVFMLRLAWSVFESWKGIALALVAHVAVALLFAAIIGFTVVGSALWAVLANLIPMEAIFAVCLAPICLLLLWAGARTERFMAEQCIRRYLNRPPQS